MELDQRECCNKENVSSELKDLLVNYEKLEPFRWGRPTGNWGRFDTALVVPVLHPLKQHGSPMGILGCYSYLLYLVYAQNVAIYLDLFYYVSLASFILLTGLGVHVIQD